MYRKCSIKAAICVVFPEKNGGDLVHAEQSVCGGTSPSGIQMDFTIFSTWEVYGNLVPRPHRILAALDSKFYWLLTKLNNPEVDQVY